MKHTYARYQNVQNFMYNKHKNFSYDNMDHIPIYIGHCPLSVVCLTYATFRELTIFSSSGYWLSSQHWQLGSSQHIVCTKHSSDSEQCPAENWYNEWNCSESLVWVISQGVL